MGFLLLGIERNRDTSCGGRSPTVAAQICLEYSHYWSRGRESSGVGRQDIFLSITSRGKRVEEVLGPASHIQSSGIARCSYVRTAEFN